MAATRVFLQPLSSDSGFFVPTGLRWARGWDLAVSKRTDADFTASFRCAFDKLGNLYIADGIHERLAFPDQRRLIFERMIAERSTEHGVELALHGQAVVQDLRRVPKIRFAALRGVKVETDKITRALPWSEAPGSTTSSPRSAPSQPPATMTK